MPLKIAMAHHDPAAIKTLQQVIARETDYSLAWGTTTSAEAVRKCRQDRPDLLLADLALAGRDGGRLVCDIMKDTPCAILILSDAINRDTAKVFEAMGCGALDAIATPVTAPDGRIEGADALLKKITTLAKLLGGAAPSARPRAHKTAPAPERLPPLVAVGSSTGGPRALATILAGFPENLDAAVMVCQHVDLQFAQGLAQWLDSQTPLAVTLAEEGMRPRAGTVLVAATNDHLVLGSDGRVHYTGNPKDYPYRPSVNAFFESLVKYWPRKDLAVLLTGMGRDGAEGITTLRKAGWHTIVQDQKTSVVYGMPAAAVELGGAAEILPVEMIAGAIIKKLPSLKE